LVCLQDRCHRIGQTKNVSIYKLVAEDTVDEIIFETGQRKQRLTKAVLSDHGPSAGDGEGEEEEGGGAGKRRKGAKGSAAAGDGAGAGVGGGSEINKMLQAALQNYIRAKD
jgi:ATP-dependent DNA helicase